MPKIVTGDGARGQAISSPATEAVADRRERPLTAGKTADLRERPGGEHLACSSDPAVRQP